MTFNARGKMSSHKLIAHSTDKKYQCKFCGLRLGGTTQLKSHERTHQEAKFKCTYCDKKLTTRKGLEWHERQHTEDKPFKCPLCDIGFPSGGGLAQHKRGVHKIEGPRGSRPGCDAYKKKSRSKGQLLTPKWIIFMFIFLRVNKHGKSVQYDIPIRMDIYWGLESVEKSNRLRPWLMHKEISRRY